ncbi:hypothetical protein SASPL_144850 [Salvia splendens]|uniref:Uncharacterized protein n=1 Tax=Salvia splendens TaxID=180675 RepID=A0A8X8WGK4_SALSN|nr:hypothetical protein SASPL_144850 [Salvia splendens]
MPTLTTLFLCFITLSHLAFLSAGADSELSLAANGPATLQLSPTLIVENSPGSKPGAKIKCGRVLIHGLPRIKHLNKYANSMKVKVSHATSSGRPPNIYVCFHRNVTLEIGMCPHDQWERLSDGFWIKPMSPFDHKVIDIRMGASYSENIQVSLDEGLSSMLCLYLALAFAKELIKADTIPYFWNRVDEFGFCAQQVLSFLLQWCHGCRDFTCDINGPFPGDEATSNWSKRLICNNFVLLLCMLAWEPFYLAMCQDCYIHYWSRLDFLKICIILYLLIFLIIFLLIVGSWLGFWAVRKLVITDDGYIDDGVSQFATWSIRIISSVLILQSSIDPLLAIDALIGGILFSLGLRSIQPKLVRRVYKKLSRPTKSNVREPVYPYGSPVANSSASRPSIRASYTPVQGQTSKSPITDSETFYSSFHDAPYQRKFAKDEWEAFTKESTRKALEELVASPDFNRWAVSHADRITLAPKKEDAYKQRRWFQWF